MGAHHILSFFLSVSLCTLSAHVCCVFVHAYICECVHESVCAFVCVCERERERESNIAYVYIHLCICVQQLAHHEEKLMLMEQNLQTTQDQLSQRVTEVVRLEQLSRKLQVRRYGQHSSVEAVSAGFMKKALLWCWNDFLMCNCVVLWGMMSQGDT